MKRSAATCTRSVASSAIEGILILSPARIFSVHDAGNIRPKQNNPYGKIPNRDSGILPVSEMEKSKIEDFSSHLVNTNRV